MVANNGREPKKGTGLDIVPGAWEAWRIAIVGAAGEKGLYDLIVPGGQANVKIDSRDNRNHRFLLSRATGSPAVGVMREFKGHLGMPDGRGADDGIGAWIAILRWNDMKIDPAGEREEAMDTYYNIQLKPSEHPESLWTHLEMAREKLANIQIDLNEGALERRFLKAIHQSREGRQYYNPLRAHQLAERQGKFATTKDLRTALTFKYEKIQLACKNFGNWAPFRGPPSDRTLYALGFRNSLLDYN